MKWSNKPNKRNIKSNAMKKREKDDEMLTVQ